MPQRLTATTDDICNLRSTAQAMSEARPGAAPRHRVRETLATTAVAVLAFAVGLVLFNSVLMPRIVHRAGEVIVPDVENLTIEQAQSALEPTGLVLSRAGERFDPSVERGRIVVQDPAAGTPVRGHRRVSVTVSLGEEFSSVPELLGETRRGAELLLEHAGLHVGGVTRAPSDAVAEGLVAATDPPAGSVLPHGAEVALLLSTGPTEEVYVMPDVKGREIGRTRRQLEAHGFVVLSPPAGPSMGPIVAQDPPPGARLTRDRNITLQAAGRLIR
jgi:beta-lactam-binding protein with PASTA domain